jgi:hypothetical protein
MCGVSIELNEEEQEVQTPTLFKNKGDNKMKKETQLVIILNIYLRPLSHANRNSKT